MIVEIQHETRFEYTEPVTEAVTEVRMEPITDAHQSCHSFHLAVSPHAPLSRFQDGFGNRVHHFNVLTPSQHVRILAAAVVETHPHFCPLDSSRATWPLNLEQAALEVHDYLRFRGPVNRSPGLRPLIEALQPKPGSLLGEFVQRSLAYIADHFQYARDVTLATSPIDDLLSAGKGVCQDFTHLLIALARSFDVPARYVSGYLHRPNQESQSHAWCEVWLPNLGWVGVDPTNNCLVNASFVKVAFGRDFTDVPPNKGVYRGNGHERISVRVETRELERLPSLSWQEQLPPLHLPLTAVVNRHRADFGVFDESQQ